MIINNIVESHPIIIEESSHATTFMRLCSAYKGSSGRAVTATVIWRYRSHHLNLYNNVVMKSHMNACCQC